MRFSSAVLAALLLAMPAGWCAPSPAPAASAPAGTTLRGTLRTWDGPRFKVKSATDGSIQTFTKAPGIVVDKTVKPGSDVVVTWHAAKGVHLATRVSDSAGH